MHVVKDGRGLGRLYFGQRKLGFMRVIQSDYTGAPGSLHELFAGEMEHGFAQTEVINAHDFPAMMHKAPRLQLMDEQGLEATLMFPTVAVAVEHELHDDVDACYANLRAFNKWIEEDWGYGADGRVFGAPMLSLLSPEHAVAELDRVLAVGANMVHVKAARRTAARGRTRPMIPSGRGSTRPACRSRSTPATPATTSCGRFSGESSPGRRCSS